MIVRALYLPDEPAYQPHPDPAAESARVDYFEAIRVALIETLEARVAARRELTEGAGISEEEWLAADLAGREAILARARRLARRRRAR